MEYFGEFDHNDRDSFRLLLNADIITIVKN